MVCQFMGKGSVEIVAVNGDSDFSISIRAGRVGLSQSIHQINF